ncbi:shaker-related potassium channel tsha2-like [Tubulanus polymorphus]|uniref:shaker-related potassium channel tsha2-like n=1 Tax=Tubulanus polymorphus TaxID=672921 RepID=UPI003DA32884
MDVSIKGADDSMLILDVGGRRFKTWQSTLQRIPNTRLAMLNHESKYYNRETGEYFFDRNPDIFENVLDFYRTGELHVPLSKCGCWAEKETLEKFDKDVNERTPPNRGHNEVWIFLEYPKSSKLATIYSVLSYLAILTSVLIIIISTLEVFRRKPTTNEWAYYLNMSAEDVQNSSTYISKQNLTFRSFGILVAEHSVLSLFAIEYLVRLISCPYKLEFISHPLNIVDLLSIVPLVIQAVFIFGHPTLRFSDIARRLFRAFEVVRVFRLFRLIKKYRGFQVILYSLIRSSAEIALLIVVIVMGTILFGSLIYYADDRDMFDNMFSGLWWAVITITTVGYGDYYPVTPFGYVIGTICALSSMLIVGISVSEIVSSFDMYYRYSKTDTEIDESSRTYHPPDVESEVFHHPPIAVNSIRNVESKCFENTSYCKELSVFSAEVT